MQTKKLDNQVTVATQIGTGDVAAIKAGGFRAVMCNRPDGEEAGQPRWDEIAAACAAAGLDAHFVPLAGREVTMGAVQDFGRAMRETDGPILAYCRTGARCEILWNAARQLDQAARTAAD